MVQFYGPKRRKMFDEDANWLPQKNRPFVLKNPVASRETQVPRGPTKQEVKPQPRRKTTDAKGLKTAYASESGFHVDPDRTLHMAGTRGSFVGDDWMENYKVYGPGLFNTLKDYYGLLNSGKFEFKDWFAPESQPNNIEDTKNYKALDQYMKDNPGQVDNFIAHSKAGSVVEKWTASRPEWQGHARLYGTPHIDPIGSEKFKDFLNQSKQERETTTTRTLTSS